MKWLIRFSLGNPHAVIVMSLAILASTGLEPVALAFAGALASRELALLFWGSAIAVELTAVFALLSRSVREL